MKPTSRIILFLTLALSSCLHTKHLAQRDDPGAILELQKRENMHGIFEFQIDSIGSVASGTQRVWKAIFQVAYVNAHVESYLVIPAFPLREPGGIFLPEYATIEIFDGKVWRSTESGMPIGCYYPMYHMI